MPNIDFSPNEIFEIEKLCDYQAGVIVQELGRTIDNISKFGKNPDTEQLIGKLIKDSVKAYDILRTISAKCELARKK